VAAKKKHSDKKPESTQEMTTLYVLYTQTSKGGQSKGKGLYEGRTDRYTTTAFKGAVLAEAPPYAHGTSYESFEVPKIEFEKGRTQVFAVVGYYDDGDSFGNSFDNMHIVAVYGNPAKAYAVARVLEKENKEATESIFGSAFRVPWGGYFSRLARVEVESLSVVRMDLKKADTTEDIDPNDIPSW
jgi:hypothetical protein